jgi:hypothetical protein
VVDLTIIGLNRHIGVQDVDHIQFVQPDFAGGQFDPPGFDVELPTVVILRKRDGKGPAVGPKQERQRAVCLRVALEPVAFAIEPRQFRAVRGILNRIAAVEDVAGCVAEHGQYGALAQFRAGERVDKRVKGGLWCSEGGGQVLRLGRRQGQGAQDAGKGVGEPGFDHRLNFFFAAPPPRFEASLAFPPPERF